MSTTAEYIGFNNVRENLKPIFDRALSGHVVTIGRGESVAAVIDSEMLLEVLKRAVANRPEVSFEDAVVIALPGVPVAAEASSLDEAVEEMVDALRDYAEDWDDHLHDAPNHAVNYALVMLVRLSTDDQLRDWLIDDDHLSTGGPERSPEVL